MNTRIQVEHPVTELTHGVDLVEQQLSIAAHRDDHRGLRAVARGHAIELRDLRRGPEEVLSRVPARSTSWVEPTRRGHSRRLRLRRRLEVTPHFDSLIAKVCAYGETREHALARIVRPAANSRSRAW